MKKILIAMVAAFCAAFTVSAAEVAGAAGADPFVWEQPQYKTYTVFNLGILPKIPGWQDNTETIGIKTGWPVVTGQNATMTGCESSWVYSGSDYMTGVQASMLLNRHLYGYGFQPAIVMNLSMKSLVGMQASCVFNYANNVMGVQAGAVNILTYINGFQPGVLFNYADKVEGCQAGLFGIIKKLNGCQLGGVNITEDASEGFQIGFVNIISNGKGMQFGIFNILPGAKIPFTLFFNMGK